jgi:hypothetical protein
MAVRDNGSMYAVGCRSYTLLLDSRTVQAIKKIPSRYSGCGESPNIFGIYLGLDNDSTSNKKKLTPLLSDFGETLYICSFFIGKQPHQILYTFYTLILYVRFYTSVLIVYITRLHHHRLKCAEDWPQIATRNISCMKNF